MELQFLSFSELYRSLSDSNEASISFTKRSIKDSPIIFKKNHISRGLRNINFVECEFIGDAFFLESIKNGHLSILFDNCSFLGEFKIDQCEFSILRFLDTKEIKTIDILGTKISNFLFKNKSKKSEYDLNGEINISGNTFTNKVDFENLKHTTGSFMFQNMLETKERNSPNDKVNASFSNTKLCNAEFSETNFGDEVSFDKMILNEGEGIQNFDNCIFGKAYFNGTNFGKYAFFNGSIFNGVAIFHGCQNLEYTITDFSGMTFKEEVYFDSSQFKDLTITNTSFKAKSSFENTKFGTVCLNQVIFEKAAFFDDITITEIKKCDRKSIRTIKEQLQKTDNRIDYNRFKAFELDAYAQELKKENWRDRLILWINSISSNHGLNWFQALKFTLAIGLILYIPYFISENHANEFELSYNSFNHFTKGYFGFLVPSYKSPFENGLTQWYQYFIFITGKIFISYGIYQTIVSFRKYRL